jgi:hypothetical protein
VVNWLRYKKDAEEKKIGFVQCLVAARTTAVFDFMEAGGTFPGYMQFFYLIHIIA